MKIYVYIVYFIILNMKSVYVFCILILLNLIIKGLG